MIVNYHTHTRRCAHATGEDRDYVLAALEDGITLLGFSDHTPYPFDGGVGALRIRMEPEELPGYAASVRALAEEFRDQIEIRLGVEAEYYPLYFPRLLELLRGSDVEYMILGQHFLGNEIGEAHSARPTEDPKDLARYVSQCAEALQTGLFSCFAHPDIFRFVGTEADYDREMRRLCRTAKETDTPLEINLLGLREHRHYPDPRFWHIAAEEGCEVVLGSDAHSPEALLDTEGERAARQLADSLGIRLLDRIPLRRI